MAASERMATDNTLKAVQGAIERVADAISNSKTGVVYGFHIKKNESSPSGAVTYLRDAVGATPAHMDYTNDVFNYGSWENAFFMPRPCMLKSDGTVDYYLNPHDVFTSQIIRQMQISMITRSIMQRARAWITSTLLCSEAIWTQTTS